MSKTVYIVFARAGMYSDSTEWNVAAYAERATAEEHARKAQERANELHEWRDADGDSWQYADDETKPVNEYDPGHASRAFYGEPSYGVGEVPLLTRTPSAARPLKGKP